MSKYKPFNPADVIEARLFLRLAKERVDKLAGQLIYPSSATKVTDLLDQAYVGLLDIVEEHELLESVGWDAYLKALKDINNVS